MSGDPLCPNCKHIAPIFGPQKWKRLCTVRGCECRCYVALAEEIDGAR